MTPIAITLLTQLVGCFLMLVASALLLAEHSHIFARFQASRAVTACSCRASTDSAYGMHSTLAVSHTSATPARLPPVESALPPSTEVAAAPPEQELPAFTAPEMSDARMLVPFMSAGGRC